MAQIAEVEVNRQTGHVWAKPLACAHDCGLVVLPPYGAGEAALKPMLAAIVNAIYDATGVRIRRIPFRDDRVLGALKAAQV